MAKKPESRLVSKILKELRVQVGGWWYKVWGGPFTPAGIPDIIGCVDGLFISIEVKMPNDKSRASQVQIETIKRIRREGGVACIVVSVEGAIYVVRKALARAAKGIRVRDLSPEMRSPLRTAYRENLHKLEASPGRALSRKRKTMRSLDLLAQQQDLNVGHKPRKAPTRSGSVRKR